MTFTRVLRAVLAALLIIGLGAYVTPAYATHSSESHADSVFLDASVLGGDLSTVAGIDGAHADYFDGHTGAPASSTTRPSTSPRSAC